MCQTKPKSHYYISEKRQLLENDLQRELDYKFGGYPVIFFRIDMRDVMRPSMCKKLLILFLSCLSFLFFSSPVAGKNIKVAMILWRGETLAEQGFRSQLQTFNFSVTYHVFDAGQSRAKLAMYLRNRFVPEAWDYVYTFGTTASSMTKKKLQNKIPQIFNIVADPVKAGLMNRMEGSQENISGVTNAVSIYLQIENAMKLIHLKKLGFFFNPRENNSVIIKQRLTLLAEDLNFELISFRSPPAPGFLDHNLEKLVNDPNIVDAVYLPSDSYLLSQAAVIGKKLKAARIKGIASQKLFLDHGAYLGTVPDYFKLGELAAEIVALHQRGIHLGDIPVQRDNNPQVIINPDWSN